MLPDDPEVLLQILRVFLPLSLTAFGGGLSIISEMQYQVVEVHQWFGGNEFLALFAIARGAPGPGTMMLATLIGWKAAGFMGAITATFAMFIPSTLLCLAVAAILTKYRDQPLIKTFEAAVAPIGAGLVLIGLTSVVQLASQNMVLLAVSLGSTAICIAFPKTHPLFLIIGGALISLGSTFI